MDDFWDTPPLEADRAGGRAAFARIVEASLAAQPRPERRRLPARAATAALLTVGLAARSPRPAGSPTLLPR